MYSRTRTTRTIGENHTSTTSNPFQPRSFGVDNPQQSQSSNTKVDLDAAYEKAKIYGRNWADIPVFPPEKSATPNIQTKQIKSLEILPNITQGESQIQRQITDKALEVGVMNRHKARYTEIERLKKLIETPKHNVLGTKVYTNISTKILTEIDKQYQENIKFEQKFLYGGLSYKGDEKALTDAEYWIVTELQDISQNIQEFWREVQNADQIRQTLRTGAAKYRKDQNRTIPELYAGTVENAKEVLEGKSILARLINDNAWFTDSDGAMFVKHSGSRSAVIGYSPAGTKIPLHIGHNHKG